MTPAFEAIRAAFSRRRTYHVILLLVILAGVVVAYVTTSHYGESWDEPNNSAYGFASLKAYEGSTEFLTFGKKVYYGPFYLMIWNLASRTFKVLHEGWTQIDAGHFTNFVTYALGVGAFYVICLRFVEPILALGASMLFATQPMLYGYAFMNPKDIPFMVTVTLAVAVGIVAVDRYARTGVTGEASARSGWRRVFEASLPADLRRAGGLLRSHPWKTLGLGLLLLMLMGLLTGFPFKGWIEATIRDAYAGQSNPIVNRLFVQLAQNRASLPVEAYQAKASALYRDAQVVSGLLLLVGLIAGLKALLPASLRGLDRRWVGRHLLIVAAGGATGLATAVRIAGPLAGGLISIYAILRRGRSMIGPLVLYWGVAALAMLASYPYLWTGPVEHLLQTFTIMSGFQAHTVLYRGAYLESSSLPWDYAPNLMVLELTLPAMMCFIWGSICLCRRLIAGRQDVALAAIPVIWLGLPLIAFVVLRTSIYGNIRQLLFMLPPVFLIGSIGLSDLWRRLRPAIVQWILLAVILGPGLLGIVSLHPYEYIYFNALAGGVRGADGHYELDLWCTSYREAMGYVDQVAPPGASVSVWGPVAIAGDFARDDLVVTEANETVSSQYVLGCKRAIDDPEFYPSYQTVFEVTRDSAVLGIVKTR